MPPANTPQAQRSPTRPRTPAHQARPLTPLSYLSSPAPDLASTLYTSQAGERADAANANFLSNSLDNFDQARQQNSRFYVDASRDPRRAEYHSDNRTAPSQGARETAEDHSRRERLQRVLSRLNRMHEPATSSTSAYTDRTPSPNRQSLYDWAPAYEDGNQEENELDAILSELRRQQPETHPDILRVLGQSQLESSRPRESGTSTHDMPDVEQRRSLLRDRERRRRESEWASLRSRAVLQRARQEAGGSPSATERMLRYVMDRERSGMSEEEERARGTGWFRPSPSRGANEERRNPASSRESWLQPPAASEAREQDRQERVDAFRRGYLAENMPPRLPRISTPPVPATSSTQPKATFLEYALKYLSELRFCTRYEEALSTAIDHGLATKEFFAEKHDDFVMDLSEIPPLPYSSWLQPGTVFEGHQHANNLNSGLTHQGSTSISRVEQINPIYLGANTTSTGFDHPPGSTRVVSFDTARPFLSYPPLPRSVKEARHDDHWPVRVIIHSIDPERMTLQGTMEAYDVPQHPSSLSILNSSDRPRAGKKNAPITTYLEGHIIDLRKHSFLTPTNTNSNSTQTSPNAEIRNPHTGTPTNISFPPTSPSTDAQNWLKLSPFPAIAGASSCATPNSDAAEGTLGRALLSKAKLQAIHNEYIFMRWKERCFVHSKHHDDCSATEAERRGDQDRGHGLTISGFYYVSMRRSDGAVEGLYYDPASSPYQCLRLTGKTGGWAAWEFR